MEQVIKATLDGEEMLRLPFEVSDTLAELLTDQREKLDTIEATKLGRDRYQAARAAGCLSAVAKGVTSPLNENEIFIHRTELARTNGTIRISGLKASVNGIPPTVDVHGIIFTREDGTWTGQLKATRQEETCAS